MLRNLSKTIVGFARDHKLAAFGAVIVLLFVITGIFAGQLAPKDPNQVSVRDSLVPPNAEFPLGADNNGRDVLSRIIFGARISLYVSMTSVGLAAFVGVLLGIVAAWYRWLRAPIMRLMDVLLAFPGIVIALTIIAILGRGIENVILAIAIYQIPQFARLAHGLALSAQEQTYVEAAVAGGESDVAILSRYVFPNIVAPIIVQVSLLIPGAIMTAAGLSFIGLGVPPPTAEWGAMLQLSLTWGRLAPHMTIFPGLALMLVVFGFNVLGDGLRDALDPRLKGRG
ncbi:MAG TPA: ABC transporter permease [Longimicrobiales bacterium]|nr:ABC transporter permease [Longimicrobiales bacterium]